MEIIINNKLIKIKKLIESKNELCVNIIIGEKEYKGRIGRK